MNRLGDAYAEVQEATLKQRALAKAAKDAQPKDKVSLKKAPWDKKEEVEEDASNDKSDDGEGLDKADPKAAKKKFADRKDKDIDNDGDEDESDEYLHKRRKAVGKSIAKEDTDLTEGLSPKQIDAMKKKYETTGDRISTDNAVKMSAMVKKFGDEELIQLANADIKWISTTAITTLIIKGKKVKDFMESFAGDEVVDDDLMEAMDDLEEAVRRKRAPKIGVDSIKIQRAKDKAHADAMGRHVKSGRRKSLKAYTEESDETTPCNECDGSTENHAKDCPKNPEVEKGGAEKAVMNPKAETKTENTKWTVYNRIMEKMRGDQTKNSVKAMDPEDNQSGEEKKFVDDHEKMGTADKQADKADITIAMAKNKHAIDNPMKAAPLRPNDNKQGDLKADKPEGRM